MKKLFTLALALVAFGGVAKAATVDDLEPLKHSYVLVMDEITGTTADNAGAKPGKGNLFGANHFLDVTGGSVANNKGLVDLSVVDGNDGYVTEEIVNNYGADYPGPHYNSFRLKNAQDVIAMRLTAKTKLIVFVQGNNKAGTEARIPKIATDAALNNALNEAPVADHPSTVSGFRWEFTVDDDGLYYLGSYNGDMFVSFIIVEANETQGTPAVRVGDQTFENGLWYREVTCTTRNAEYFGQSFPTIVTYTTDGSAPTAESPKYTEPIKCYSDQTIKFQAFIDAYGGVPGEDMLVDGADNEANVSFSFDAPTINAEGANVTITSPYEGAKNFYSLNGADAVEGSNVTLTESATVSAYSQIVNGSYATFTTKSTVKDVYVLNPIKAKKTIAVTAGDVVLDEEATDTSTNGEVYKVVGGAISADKADFFVKNLTFAIVGDPQYQIDGKQVYIQMSNTNITFQVAEGDSVNVRVVTSKNSCKTLNPDNDESVTTDRKNYVNVDGTTYGHDDVTEEGGNIIEFGLGAGTHTFLKYSGTGNILISSIEIEPVSVLDLTARFTNNWNDAESNTHNEDGSITYEAKQWGGIAAWIGGEDWSEYDKIVFEYAEPTTFATQIFMQYADGTDTKALVEAGESKAECVLEAGKVAVNQAALQCAEDGTLVITKVYLVGGATNGIQTVKTLNVTNKNNAIYNLRGQKVNENYKGVVIVNGKKMLQK